MYKDKINAMKIHIKAININKNEVAYECKM